MKIRLKARTWGRWILTTRKDFNQAIVHSYTNEEQDKLLKEIIEIKKIRRERIKLFRFLTDYKKVRK